MNTTPPSAAGAPSASPLPVGDSKFLSTVECELSFELGSLRMSLAEIGKLRVGQALHLGVNLKEQPVHILSSGQEIARGELAAVGDELVVVVTSTQGLPAM